MSKSYTILGKGSTHKGLLLRALCDDIASFSELKADYDGQLSPGCLVDVAEGNVTYRLLNSGTWGNAPSNVSGGGAATLAEVEVFVADYLNDEVTVTKGVIDAYERVVVS